ncbi:Lsr2 family protein [Streptomyces sp. ODS28]|uniref:histone-like nucleoid-structuring protein Lsr2 n=1 Tax=Streptomyces sp. ODS28 TaxID=3136688 RepID=UPI0031ED56E5
MAQKVITIYTDDLTGEETEDAKTVTFSIDGVAYEIDLSPESKDKFLEDMGPYMKAGRRSGRIKDSVKPGAVTRKSAGRSQGGTQDTAKIRAWAKEQGYEVNERGRVPANIREAYEKAGA